MNLKLNFDDDEESTEEILISSPGEELKEEKGVDVYLKILENKLRKIVTSRVFNGKRYNTIVEKIIKFIRKYYLKQKECPKLNATFSGAFGEVEIDRENGIIIKKTNLFDIIIKDLDYAPMSEKKTRSVLIKLVNTLKFCGKLKTLTQDISKLFPKNMVSVDACSHCGKDRIYFLIKSGIAPGIDLQKLMKKGDISDTDLIKIELQLVYIAETINRKKLYHNDYSPHNIMIDMAKRQNISYSSGKYKLDLKNTPVPVLIDYDFVDTVPNYGVAGQDGSDMSLYLHDISNKKFKTFSDVILDHYESGNLDALNKLMKDNNITDSKISGKTGGGRKKKKVIRKQKTGGGKRKKKKVIRKHKGINQKTGKLKKGYKYSGKKSKNGTRLIVKIK